MFVKINTNYTISLLVTDSNGNRIVNDLPVAIIKNLQNNTYWNGMVWQSTMSEIILDHVAEGVYKTDFTPDSVGVYEITTKSDAYNIIKMETLEVYDSNVAQYNWKTGVPFTAKYTNNEGNTNTPFIIISDTKNNLYWNGEEWTINLTELEMTNIAERIYSYDFVPSSESEFSIFMKSEGGPEIFYILNVSTDSETTPPIIINNYTFRSQNGTDSTILDERENPINGVIITCYNSSTKEVAAKCLSNAKGEWSMALKPGKYMFVFEKEGYMSVAFERSVV